MLQNQTFPALPQGHKRFTVEQLLVEVGGEIGLRPAALRGLLFMIQRTSPGDWTARDREPIYFAPQDVTAMDLGRTRRALYNIERQLERLGLIERRLKDNGHRSPYGGCGIVFSRLVAMVPDLLDLAERLRRERRERKALRNQRSSFKRHALNLIEEASDRSAPLIETASSAIAQWPEARQLANMAIEALVDHVEAAKKLCEELDAYIQCSPFSSSKAEENDLHLIQENTEEDSLVDCNFELCGEFRNENHEDVTGSNDPVRGYEKDDEPEKAARKTRFLSRLTPERLSNLASDEMQVLIRQSQYGSDELQPIHLVDAAVRILPILGINYDAWERAAETMGQEAATISVLILDANRDHPRAPVRNPGGALRAMTARHRAGTLNLAGSLIGLARRRNG